jgi:hypothetical protein
MPELIIQIYNNWGSPARTLLILLALPLIGCQEDSSRYQIITQLLEKDQSDIIGDDNVMIFDKYSGIIYANACPKAEICKSYQWQKKVSFDPAVPYPPTK